MKKWAKAGKIYIFIKEKKGIETIGKVDELTCHSRILDDDVTIKK
ncbi:6483_t:CDS:2 [Entrophospora sp. SA101]|nr:6483_t:CDS:2 [Entrophospora sp. SA101]